MEIDAYTSITCLFGFPVRHSLSPLLHNYVYIKKKINSVYVCFQIPPEELKKAVNALKVLKITGINVTIPHKEKVVKLLDVVDSTARLVGAVNTIKVLPDGRLIGYNTDAKGFIKALKSYCGFNLKERRVILCGCGGAGRAVSVALCIERVKSLQLLDTDGEKACNLACYLRKKFQNIIVEVASGFGDLRLDSCDLFVNATPVGMKGEMLPLRLESLNRRSLVYDLVYSKSPTPLVRACRKYKIRAFNGLSMLVYQAALAEEIWFGRIRGVDSLMFEVLKGAGFI